MALKHIHDLLFKQTFSRPEVAVDFLASQLPTDVLEKLDLSKLKISLNSFIDESLKEHFADLVYECPYRQTDGEATSLRVALLFEHKSYVVRYPHFQLLRYLTNAWEADQKQGRVPRVIIPIVIFHGTGAWQRVPMIDYFPGIEAAHSQFLPDFNYLLYNLSAMTDEQIISFSNRFLALSALLLKHSREKAYLQQIGEQVRALMLALGAQDPNFLQSTVVYLYNTHSQKEQTRLLAFLKTISPQTTQLTMTIYESILKEGELKGERKGELKGELKVQSIAVRNMLIDNKLAIEKIAAYVGVTEAFVREVQQHLAKP